MMMTAMIKIKMLTMMMAMTRINIMTTMMVTTVDSKERVERGLGGDRTRVATSN